MKFVKLMKSKAGTSIAVSILITLATLYVVYLLK